MTNSYFVPEGFAGGRIDSVVAKMTGISRSKVADLIAAGDITVDGVVPGKSDRVEADALIDITMPKPANLEPQPTPVHAMEVLYEDEDIIVVDKPAGVAAHASQNFDGPNVLGALLASGVRLTTSGPQERMGIVHRLDVGTTGAMVVAKSELAYTMLKRAFRERSVTKVYHALVQGHPDPMSGTVEAPIGRDHRHQWRMAVRADGKPSITHYDTLEAMAGASLIEVHLETGRTHQIRVHMSALKHPCVGDDMYGADPRLSERLSLERQWLHAVRLGLHHPRTGHFMQFQSQYPQDLRHALDLMRSGLM
nr:RluA family pseudouridine synthase [Arcanobacterium pinnipediorum]